MSRKLKTVLAGAGGYGEIYADMLLDRRAREYFDFTAIVDPYAKNSGKYGDFFGIIPIYDTLEEFYSKNSAHLAIISTPIHLHFPQCVTALENGSHVLCEKPLVPTIEQYELLEKKARGINRTLSVGFQWCYSEVMQSLKKRILSGEFGKPVRLKSFVSWPRDRQYYERGGKWAGKIKTAENLPVYDSVASNATAHYIQNMLFLLGGTMEESANLSDTFAECYKANDIESFDTIIFSGCAGGAAVFYAASHAVNYTVNPVMSYEFEKAVILVNVFDQDFLCFVHHKNGTVENLGEAAANGEKNKLFHTAEHILGKRDFACTNKTVKPITAFIDAVFNEVPFIKFPDDFVIKDEKSGFTYVKNLHLDLMRCFELAKLPSEMGLPWAKIKGTELKINE